MLISLLADIVTAEKRSWIMSRIRGKNTSIDVKMKQMLTEISCDFQMYPKMFGSPDFIIQDKNVAIFCDGDFWHGYTYMHGKVLRKKYWREKIERNMKRDKQVSRMLRKQGWHVLRFWEHDINARSYFCMRKLCRVLDVPSHSS